MTAVDELRRAATLIRERARAATAGPWAVERDDEGMFTTVQSVQVVGWEGEIAQVHTPDPSWPDFDHIASWHPGVALAVADWLDAAHEQTGAMPSIALVVARTYLNGDSR